MTCIIYDASVQSPQGWIQAPNFSQDSDGFPRLPGLSEDSPRAPPGFHGLSAGCSTTCQMTDARAGAGFPGFPIGVSLGSPRSSRVSEFPKVSAGLGAIALLRCPRSWCRTEASKALQLRRLSSRLRRIPSPHHAGRNGPPHCLRGFKTIWKSAREPALAVEKRCLRT